MSGAPDRVRFLTVALATAFLTACGGGDATPPQVPDPKLSVTLVDAPTRLVVGERRQFVARVQDESGTEVTSVPVTWRSDDRMVATVNETGLVEALSQGLVSIFAIIPGGVRASRHVVVEQRSVPAAGIGLFPRALELAPG
ncbi:MAG TPA: Ig-like domain-containing protein, partial [Gemmatimonadaceae bacterium]|nr:Ig-like domain-containing protein [Gemmatimonadaceae bacterium]